MDAAGQLSILLHMAKIAGMKEATIIVKQGGVKVLEAVIDMHKEIQNERIEANQKNGAV